ncbi:hypothetical protein HS088_TW04G00010 [Tripterygium wilfordii]|uniref:Uncharacterized protein n=1 Tax=Tripterygium wilfordii TaxID=458696 RepID=A0A7J7DNV6_TRIWF|nr:hypothetical protein HS088_TW04G00010 [Tripterygium wilfordii]
MQSRTSRFELKTRCSAHGARNLYRWAEANSQSNQTKEAHINHIRVGGRIHLDSTGREESAGVTTHAHQEAGKKSQRLTVMGKMEVSSRRRTRSQAAPDWKVHDSLILVNEMAAIEVDCSKALSSYQKWKIIAENCTALVL